MIQFKKDDDSYTWHDPKGKGFIYNMIIPKRWVKWFLCVSTEYSTDYGIGMYQCNFYKI